MNNMAENEMKTAAEPRVEQIDSEFAMYLALKVLLKHELINQPTFDNVVKHKFQKYANVA